MKKSLMILGVLSLGLAQAQQYDGKVGVNTDTPSSTLNVKSKTGTDGTTKNLELVDANGDSLLKVLDNGNAILGKKPKRFFSSFENFPNHVSGHLGATSYWAEQNNEEGPYFHIENSSKTDNGSIWRIYNFGRTTGQGLAFVQYNNELENGKVTMMLKDDGNIGIGTGFPKGKLHVSGSSVFTPATPVDAVWVLSNPSKAGANGLIHTQISPDRATTRNAGFKEYTIGTGLTSNAEYRLGFIPELNSVNNHISLLVINGSTGNMGIGFPDTLHPTHKLHIKTEADPLKLEGLQETTDATAKNLVVVDGVVKIGGTVSSVNTGSVKIGAGANAQCTDNTIGTINFGEVTTSEGTAYAFGFCTKDANNKPMWTYMISGNNPFSSTNPTFGSGL